MKKIILLSVSLFLFFGCKLLKKVDKSESEREVSEQVIQKTTRQGDTVRYTVPKFVFKDTTIYSVNRQGTTLKTVFDDEGRVSEIECLSSRIDELMVMNRQLMESLTKKEKVEEAEPDKWFWVIIMGAAFVIFVISKKLKLI